MVDEISLYYDARSKKHQNMLGLCLSSSLATRLLTEHVTTRELNWTELSTTAANLVGCDVDIFSKQI